MCVYVLCMYTERPACSLKCCFLVSALFETGCLSILMPSYWSKSFQGFPVSNPQLAVRALEIRHAILVYVGSWDPNSDPHGCSPSSLPTESPPQFQGLEFQACFSIVQRVFKSVFTFAIWYRLEVILYDRFIINRMNAILKTYILSCGGRKIGQFWKSISEKAGDGGEKWKFIYFLCSPELAKLRFSTTVRDAMLHKEHTELKFAGCV